MNAVGQWEQMTPQIFANIGEMRRAMLSADALRSFIVVAIGTGLLLAYYFGKLKSTPVVAGIIVLCLVDMWGIDKRYLNDDMFTRKQRKEHTFPMTKADQNICQDTDTYYRVLDLSVSTFNDNTASFRHKSIGGYHPAKLRRYQELIEEHVGREMGLVKTITDRGYPLDACPGDSLFPVLNMLNTKYVIVDKNKDAVQNPWAQGNGWFVEQVEYVSDADAELAALHNVDLRKVAVVDEKFARVLGKEALPNDTTATSSVELTQYEANRLAYKVRSQQDGVVVFSEIYYPGWTCTIDGQLTDIVRANYVLRAIKVPAGKHEVIMTFDPQTVHVTETIAYVALAVLVLMLVALIGLSIYRKRQNK